MKLKNIFSSLIICFLFAVTIQSCSKSGSDPNPGGGGGTGGGGATGLIFTVDIAAMVFNPGTVTVKVGTTVKWTNSDNTVHTVTSDNGTTFNSGNIAVGATYSFTPTVAGNFPYHCNIHAGMVGTLIVTN